MLHIETEKVVFAKDIFKNRIVRGSFENPEHYSQKNVLVRCKRKDRNIRKTKKASSLK